jgi:hypothetical protein
MGAQPDSIGRRSHVTRPFEDQRRRPGGRVPQEGETLTARAAVLRVTAPAAATDVEVSINRCPYEPCHGGAGDWSFEWADYDDGDYEVMVRAKVAGEAEEMDEVRSFRVKLSA